MKTGSRFASLSILAIALVALVASGCGVSKSKYTAMTKERDDAIAKSAQLQTNLDQSNQAKAQLESEKATLDGQVKELDGKLNEMAATAAEHQKALDEAKTQYDAMVGKLQTELSSGKIEIEQMRDGINVNLAQDILFKSGSADLDKTGRELLLKVADNLKASPYQLNVIGHTDNQKIGGALAKKYPSNWELGGARAAQIVRVFEQAGISKDRLASVSCADSRPRDANDTAEGRAKNRRIEIRLRPVADQQTAGSN